MSESDDAAVNTDASADDQATPEADQQDITFAGGGDKEDKGDQADQDKDGDGSDKEQDTDADADADAGKDEGEKSEDKDGDKPIEYEDFAVPDGMEIDETVLNGAKDVFSKHGISQEAANDLVAYYTGMLSDQMKASQEAFSAQQQSWVDELKADKEIGGEKLDRSIMVAQKAFNKYANDELRETLTNTGLDRHPDMFRFFVKLANDVLDDSELSGEGSQSSGDDIYDRWYPKK